MFERFTDRARKVMALADQEARRLNHEYIGSEHVLLGLVKEGSGNATRLLRQFGIPPGEVRLQVEKLLKSGPEQVTTSKLPQTPHVKQTIEYAIQEARLSHLVYVGTEHLLLGLLRLEDGVAAGVFMELNVELESVRKEAFRLSNEDDEPPADRATGAEEFDAPPLVLLLDPGTATAEEISELLLEFSTLYRMLGGSGITFTTADAREPAIA